MNDKMEDMKFAVHMNATLSLTVKISLSEDELRKIAKDNGMTLDELLENEDIVNERASDKAWMDNQFSSLCIHCSGGGMGSNFSADLSEFEPDEENEVERI